jgi:hypothetical protein
MSATGQPSGVEMSLVANLSGAVLSEVGLTLPEQISFEQWQQVGRELGRFQRASCWWIGDWWAFAEHRWGERKTAVESEDWPGPGFKASANAASVCRVFPGESFRRRELSFTHHAEVAGIEDEVERESLLDWCEEPVKSGAGKPRTIRALRQELAQRGLRPAKSAAPSDSEEEVNDDDDVDVDVDVVDDQQNQEDDQSDDETTLHFEPRPQHILAGILVGYLEKIFLCVDKAPPEQRRPLLEKERDQVMAAIEEQLKTLVVIA